MHPLTRGALETDHRLSVPPEFMPWRHRGIPGYWAILFERAKVVHTPPGHRLLAHFYGDDTAAFRLNGMLGYPGMYLFRGRNPPAHSLAAYASSTPLPWRTQRLATDLPGSALVGQGLHLLDG